MINKKYGISANQISNYGFKLCLEVYEKYGRKCSVCGSEDYLAIHHIDGKGRNYEKKGGEQNNSLDNLQLMCRVCHGRLHGSAVWKYGEDQDEWPESRIEKRKEYIREYHRRPEYKAKRKIYLQEYHQRPKYLEYRKKYRQSKKKI